MVSVRTFWTDGPYERGGGWTGYYNHQIITWFPCPNYLQIDMVVSDLSSRLKKTASKKMSATEVLSINVIIILTRFFTGYSTIIIYIERMRHFLKHFHTLSLQFKRVMGLWLIIWNTAWYSTKSITPGNIQKVREKWAVRKGGWLNRHFRPPVSAFILFQNSFIYLF